MVETTIWYYVLNGLVSMLIPVFLIGFLWQRGFFFKFLRVKLSGGAKVLVRGWNITHFTYEIGSLIDGFLIFKHEKESRRLVVKSPDFYRAMKIVWIDVDLETNIIIRREGVAGTPYDAEKYQNLYLRAMMAPALKNVQNYLLIGALALLIILTIVESGLVYKSYQLLFDLSSQVTTEAVKGVVG